MQDRIYSNNVQENSKNILKKIEKIMQYIDKEGISIAEFERENKLGNGYLKKMEKSGSDVSYKVLEKIRINSIKAYTEMFGEPQTDTKKPPSPNGEEGYKDKYIQLLEQQLQDRDRQLSELKLRMDSRTLEITQQIETLSRSLTVHDQQAKIATAYAKTLFLQIQKVRSKLERVPLDKVADDMDTSLTQQLEEVFQSGAGNGN